MHSKVFFSCISVSVFSILCLCMCSRIWAGGDPSDKPKFSFGVIADVQYCDGDTAGSRHYRKSPEKLEACISDLNTRDLAFVIQLGDFIDRDFASFDKVLPILQKLEMQQYHVLGNHDFSVAGERLKDVPKKLGMPGRFYDFTVDGWRFVVLDGNDASLFATEKNSKRRKEAEALYKKVKESASPNAVTWNGGLGTRQMAWLKKSLGNASREGEKVILFCHFPVYPHEVHCLWNNGEVLKILESHDCVVAYINGHNHAGGYHKKGDIHFLNIQGMVETADKNAYTVIEVHEDRLEIIGMGREPNRTLHLKPAAAKISRLQ